MRSVVLLLSTERAALLRKPCGYTVESQRYVRALRRTPVKVLYPDDPKPKPKLDPAPKAPVRTSELKKRSPAPGRIPSHVSPGSEESEVRSESKSRDKLQGLRFEKADAGDKRLA